MGVKELNKVLNECSTESTNKHHDVVIIDGSNLIFQVLTSQLGKLKKNNNIIKQWNSLDLPLISSTVFILQNSFNDVSNVLNRYLDEDVKEIYVVMDPSQTPCYKINTAMTYNHKYEHLITGDDVLSTGSTVELNIKVAEQELRKKRNSKTENMMKEISYIQQLKESQNLTDEEIEILISIYKQSYCYFNNSDLLRLAWVVLKKIDCAFNDKGVKVIDCVDEADLVIKNIACEYPEDISILVLSMDTDYNILFSDTPNVDTASLMNPMVIHNPCKCWKQILGEAYSYEAVIRISPMFGNDYTVGEPIISAKNYKDVLALFNINNTFDELKRSARKKIYKVVYGVKQPEGLTKLEDIDEMIHNWNVDYFKKYYLSTIIYENWNMYNRYKILEKQDEISVEQEMNKALKKLLSSINDDYDKDEKITLYTWNSTFLFNDWDNFFDTIEKKSFENFDDFLDYYYECESNNLEDGGEFV